MFQKNIKWNKLFRKSHLFEVEKETFWKTENKAKTSQLVHQCSSKLSSKFEIYFRNQFSNILNLSQEEIKPEHTLQRKPKRLYTDKSHGRHIIMPLTQVPKNSYRIPSIIEPNIKQCQIVNYEFVVKSFNRITTKVVEQMIWMNFDAN